MNVFEFKTVTVVENPVERGGVIGDFVALVGQIWPDDLSDAHGNFAIQAFSNGSSDVRANNVFNEVSARVEDGVIISKYKMHKLINSDFPILTQTEVFHFGTIPVV